MKRNIIRQFRPWFRLLVACAAVTMTGCTIGYMKLGGSSSGTVVGALGGAADGGIIGGQPNPDFTATDVPYAGLGESFPSFPSKPPRPNRKHEITHFFTRTGNSPIIWQLAQQIDHMLARAGYDDELRYFSFQDYGFAIATPLEHFDEDTGRPMPGRHRFVTSLAYAPPISGILDYARRVLTGKQGQFRMFVILATSEHYELATGPMTEEDRGTLTRGGADRLPPSILLGKWNDDVRVQLLVYEFDKRAGAEANVASAPQKADWHFEASGLQASAKVKPATD
ncbi:MAG: hypothetical protein ACO1TE_11590 [Prosthecobacter sp.]